MSSSNVLPSSPELYPMNEITQINAEDFRLKKISDLQTELTNEAEHYRQVLKNINDHTPWHTSSCGSWFSFCWVVISNPCNSLDGFWNCCKPRACRPCNCFRVVVCWLYGGE